MTKRSGCARRVLLVTGVVCACGGGTDGPPPDPAAEALRVEQQMVEAMGGRDAWESARFFDFVWAANRTTPDEERPPFERRHVWDRWTGRYKLEAPTPDGDLVAVFPDVNVMQGDVWIDGVAVLDTLRVDSLLDRAHSAFINDTYWFLMPFKWRDPGVLLEYKGVTVGPAGKEWETVELTFEGVGRTPNNRYMAYVDPETHFLGWWEHFREREMTETNTRTQWLEWERRGPIFVSLNRPRLDGTQAVFFPRVEISAEVREDAFAPPN